MALASYHDARKRGKQSTCHPEEPCDEGSLSAPHLDFKGIPRFARDDKLRVQRGIGSLSVKRVLNFIGGEFRPPCSGRYLTDLEPATGKAIAEIADSGPEDVDAAVGAASGAFE